MAAPTMTLTEEMRRELRAYLLYMWKDIHYQYEGLTEAERARLSETTFDHLVSWAWGQEGDWFD